jgi:hypothetical protein
VGPRAVLDSVVKNKLVIIQNFSFISDTQIVGRHIFSTTHESFPGTTRESCLFPPLALGTQNNLLCISDGTSLRQAPTFSKTIYIYPPALQKLFTAMNYMFHPPQEDFDDVVTAKGAPRF